MILSPYFSDYKEINALRAPGWVQIYENERISVHFHKSVPGFFINLYLALTKETANLSEPSPQKLPVP